MHKLRIIRPGDTVYTSLFIDGSCIKAATLQVKHVNGRPYVHPTFGCDTLEISVPGASLFSFNENVTLEHINKLFRKNIQREWCVPFNHIEVKTQSNNESKNEKLNRFGAPDLFCYFIYKNGPMKTRDLLVSLREIREKDPPKVARDC